MKTVFFTLLTTAALLTASTSATAQGAAFTYQGQLSASGNPANGRYDLTFTLYDTNVLPGNIVAGPLTNSATPVSNGLFTVTLNFGAGVFNGSNYWLQITAATNGGAATTLAPRQPITPAPYAIYAPNAGLASSASFVAASNISGALLPAQLPAAVVTNNATVTLSGTFSGNGSGLTNIPITQINSDGGISLNSNALYGDFIHSATINFGNEAYSVTAVDIHGNGKIDLVFPNGNNIAIYTNNGHGTFSSFASLSDPSIYDPLTVVAADLNGDGYVDLAVDNGAGTLTIFTNNGSGGFVFSSNPANPPTETLFSTVIAVDLSRNKRPDLVTADYYDNRVNVLVNNGAGSFNTSYAVNVGNGPTTVAAADFTGTGRLDVVCANSTDGTITMLTNNGAGILFSNATYSVGPLNYFVTAADINGDGKVDLISASVEYGTMSIYTNNGNGTFTFASTFSVNGGQFIGVADVNNDGFPDLVVADIYDNVLNVLTNNGYGRFTALSSPLATGSNPNGVAIADINGDGQPDLISADESGDDLTIYTNSPTGAFRVTGLKYSGSGSGLTGLNAASLVGSIPVSVLPANLVTLAGNNGGGLINLNAASLVGSIPLSALPGGVAQLANNQTFSGRNTFATNVIISNTVAATNPLVTVQGNQSGGFGQPTVLIQNNNTASTAAPALRVQASGDTVGGALSVSSQNTGLIAQFGNGSAFVADIQNNGTMDAPAFNTTSDRNAKAGFTPVNVQSVLDRVAALPITEWHFKADADTRHIGPMAQDFRAAFHVGTDEKHIATVDEDGVALAAIQALNEKLKEKDAEIQELRTRLDRLEKQPAK